MNLRLTLTYNVVHGQIVVLAKKSIVSADRRTCSNHSYTYEQIRTNTEEYRNSFLPLSWRCNWLKDAKFKELLGHGVVNQPTEA